jgi:hypothetical protein
MKMKERLVSSVAVLIVINLILAACDSGAPVASSTPTPVSEPTKQDVAVINAHATITALSRRVDRLSATQTAIIPSAAASSTPEPPAPPTDTVVPTAVATESPPTAASQQATNTPKAETFTSLGFRSYRGDFSTNVVGAFRYNGKNPVQSPDITVTLYDANNTVVASAQAFTKPQLVQPGGLVPYNALFSDAPSDWARTEINIRAEDASNFWLSLYTTDFEVSATNMVSGQSYNPLRVLGRVTNKAGVTTKLIQIIAILYDTEGKVLDVEAGYTAPSGLEAGGSESFEVIFYNTKQAAKFEVVVTGSREP